jgi:hypothetical protein
MNKNLKEGIDYFLKDNKFNKDFFAEEDIRIKTSSIEYFIYKNNKIRNFYWRFQSAKLLVGILIPLIQLEKQNKIKLLNYENNNKKIKFFNVYEFVEKHLELSNLIKYYYYLKEINKNFNLKLDLLVIEKYLNNLFTFEIENKKEIIKIEKNKKEIIIQHNFAAKIWDDKYLKENKSTLELKKIILQDIKNIKNINIKHLTDELLYELVLEKGISIIKLIPKKLFNKELTILFCKMKGYSIKYIPKKYLTEEMYLIAIKENYEIIKIIPQNKINLAMTVAVLKYRNKLIEYIPYKMIKKLYLNDSLSVSIKKIN